MTVFLTPEVILCLASNVFWEKLKLFMTFPVPSGKPWVCSKGFFPGAAEGFLRMRFTLCPLWITALLKLPGGLGAEGVCDVPVCVPPEEEASNLSCQASSIKGMNWCVPPLPLLSIPWVAVCPTKLPSAPSSRAAMSLTAWGRDPHPLHCSCTKKTCSGLSFVSCDRSSAILSQQLERLKQ